MTPGRSLWSRRPDGGTQGTAVAPEGDPFTHKARERGTQENSKGRTQGPHRSDPFYHKPTTLPDPPDRSLKPVNNDTKDSTSRTVQSESGSPNRAGVHPFPVLVTRRVDPHDGPGGREGERRTGKDVCVTREVGFVSAKGGTTGVDLTRGERTT